MLYKMTSFVICEKLKIENHFYEMIAATVSHDMRTPINAITGLTESLEGFVEDERGKFMLNIVKSSSRILHFLVNDLLDFFLIKNRKFTISSHLVSPRKGIKDLIDIFNLLAHQRNIKILLKISPNVPE